MGIAPGPSKLTPPKAAQEPLGGCSLDHTNVPPASVAPAAPHRWTPGWRCCSRRRRTARCGCGSWTPWTASRRWRGTAVRDWSDPFLRYLTPTRRWGRGLGPYKTNSPPRPPPGGNHRLLGVDFDEIPLPRSEARGEAANRPSWGEQVVENPPKTPNCVFRYFL